MRFGRFDLHKALRRAILNSNLQSLSCCSEKQLQLSIKKDEASASPQKIHIPCEHAISPEINDDGSGRN